MDTAVIPSFDEATLEEKQRYYFNAFLCKYCQTETEYVSSLAVYREDFGMIHLCPKKGCGAYCGCLPNSDQSVGTTAMKPLRDLRITCHHWFDPLVEIRAKVDGKRKAAQINARKWLSSLLDIDIQETHIGYFNESLCERTIEICKAVHEDLKEKAIIREEITQKRVGAFIFSCARLKLEPNFFDINGSPQYELHDAKARFFKFLPAKGTGQWDSGKIFLIEDIETFITEHFKTENNAK